MGHVIVRDRLTAEEVTSANGPTLFIPLRLFRLLHEQELAARTGSESKASEPAGGAKPSDSAPGEEGGRGGTES